MQAKPLTDTVSPVSVQELQSFLDVDSDAMLEDLLSVATDTVISYLNIDLLPRQWKLTVNVRRDPLTVDYNRFPTREWGWVQLPYTNLVSVQSVKVDNETVEYLTDTESRPGRVYPKLFGDQLVITYTAGNSKVPATIKTGIKMLAGYLYEHAGACDVTDALKKSGAQSVLSKYRVEW